MQLIGLLGGMSWQSTAEYYRLINELARRHCGGLHSARCLVYSVDFATIEGMQAEGRWDAAGKALGEAAKALESAGADFIVLCTNTMHKVADQVQQAVDIPLLHLVDTAAEAVKAHGIATVGLLGTRFTMTEPFYREHLASRGLRVIVPDFDDQILVNDVIYNELCLGEVRLESREAYRQVIRRLVEKGAEGIIYGCTEIELLVDQSDSEVQVFPTTQLHCAAAADRAIGSGLVRRPHLP
ncbi:MAG: aspartate/glutamate racemase family protein [Natronosporangium sp.]